MSDMWFESGNIPEAIELSKKQSKLFLVYITGDDEISKKMDELWDNDGVAPVIKSSCIALKLSAESVSCKQFSAIYPVLCIPSAYFIESKGKIVEALPPFTSLNEFIRKIETVTKPYLKNEEKPPVAEGTSANESSCGHTKIDQVKFTKNTGEGKSSTSSQQMSRNAEKENRTAERVESQIENYRNSTAEKFENQAAEKQKKQEEKEHLLQEEQEKKEAVRQSNSRIQFRLPDGSAIAGTFKAEDLLASALEFLKNESTLDLGNKTFTLSRVYPRKKITDDDHNKTFREMDMVPSASLMVLPSDEITVKSSSIFDSVLSFFLFLLTLPVRLLSGLRNLIAGSEEHISQASPISNQGNLGAKSTGRQRIPNDRNLRMRRGNMARLSDTQDDDDDDENATWNGNSTQQM